MRPGFLKRRTWLRRRARPVEDQVTPDLWLEVMSRDSYRCIAARFDPEHICQGHMTFEHVPEQGHNALGRRAPSDRYHGVAACQGAQQGWCLTHRADERAWLEALYGPPPYPSPEDTDGRKVHPTRLP